MTTLTLRDFANYLRIGRLADPQYQSDAKQTKFNPYHDANDGRFTFGPGSTGTLPVRFGSSGNGSSTRLSSGKPEARADPIGDIIEQRLRQNSPSAHTPKRSIGPQESKPVSKLSHWPIAGTSVQSLNRVDKPGEGNPRYGTARTRGKHRGIDIKAPHGTPVRAAAAGMVVRIVPNPSRSFGDQIVVFHGNGIFTQYAHLEHGSSLVRPGARVMAGQTLARVGRAGNTPPRGDSHLHFEVRIGSSAPASSGGHTRDPLEYLPR